jgi:hypothetical protein
MKKLLVTLSVIALVGAGCAGQKAADKPQESGSTNPQVAGQPVSDVPTTPGGQQESPAVNAPEKPIDDSAWVATTTRAGVTITAPVKGSYAPTWTVTILKKDDPHLQGNCYVTTSTVYKKTPVTGFENACQTSTAFSADAGVRTDYFVMQVDTQLVLITFTKTHAANFNHNDYSATLDHVISIID